MEKYIPDMYQQSIYTIDYHKLYDRGIRCILFDLDNTLVPINVKIPSRQLKDLFDDLKEQGFNVIIFSNSHDKRIKPFKEELNVECCSWAFKPFKKNFSRIINQYGYNETEVAIVGDQIFTDVLGGNKIGITTILVTPISKKDFILTKFNRVGEKIIMYRLRNNNLFVKGRYYE